MSWTKEEFFEFCRRCGQDPKKALKEGKVSLSGPDVTGATLASIASKQKRKNNAIRAFHKIQDSFSEPAEPVALGKEVCEQAEGMECPNARFRISIIGCRVKPIDPDNFTAGCKGIIDGIVASGIVTGDDWKTVEISCSQKRVAWADLEGTTIIIESIEKP